MKRADQVFDTLNLPALLGSRVRLAEAVSFTDNGVITSLADTGTKTIEIKVRGAPGRRQRLVALRFSDRTAGLKIQAQDRDGWPFKTSGQLLQVGIPDAASGADVFQSFPWIDGEITYSFVIANVTGGSKSFTWWPLIIEEIPQTPCAD